MYWFLFNFNQTQMHKKENMREQKYTDFHELHGRQQTLLQSKHHGHLEKTIFRMHGIGQVVTIDTPVPFTASLPYLLNEFPDGAVPRAVRVQGAEVAVRALIQVVRELELLCDLVKQVDTQSCRHNYKHIYIKKKLYYICIAICT